MEDQFVWVPRCMIIETSMVEVARSFACEFGTGGEGMWIVSLAPKGALAPTHFISSGMIDKVIADAMDDPSQLKDVAALFGFDIPLETCAGMLSAGHIFDLSDGRTAFDCMAEMELEVFSGVVSQEQLQSRPLKDVLGELLA